MKIRTEIFHLFQKERQKFIFNAIVFILSSFWAPLVSLRLGEWLLKQNSHWVKLGFEPIIWGGGGGGFTKHIARATFESV